jgi:hypothetical protein
VEEKEGNDEGTGEWEVGSGEEKRGKVMRNGAFGIKWQD